jgi:hypothetical protein
MAEFTDSADLSGIDPWGVAQGRSIPTIKFQFSDAYGNAVPAAVGTEYTLQTIEDLDVVQQRDFDTQQPEFWPDGKPKLNLVITGTLVSTNVDPSNYLDGDDDELNRRFFFKGQSQQALQEEMKRLGLKRFGIGTKVTIALTGFRPPKNGRGYPTKLYTVTITDPTPYVAPEQRQVESALAPSQPTTPNVQAQTSFPTTNTPVASAAPAQVAPVQVQDQPVQQPVAAAPAPQPAAPVQVAQQPVAQPVQQPVATPTPTAEAAPQPTVQAPAFDTAAARKDYEMLIAGGIDHDLAVQSLSTKYAVDKDAFESAIAI